MGKPSEQSWILYGANGYTGRLCVEQALEAGLRPTLAGRDEAAVRAIAEPRGLPWRCFGLGQLQQVAAALEDQALVLHCAGPFSSTSEPMRNACLRTRTHYLDITGEIDVFEAVFAMGEQAKRAGIACVPGVGFDVVPTDCLAARLAEALPSATSLELAFAGGAGLSPGTVKTGLENLPLGSRIRKDGEIISVDDPPRATIPFRDHPRETVAVAWGDVSTAFHTTGIRNVVCYAGIPKEMRTQVSGKRWMKKLSGMGPVQKIVRRYVAKKVTGPNAEARAQARMHVWGRVSDPEGQTVEGTLELPEGYTITATFAVASVQRVLAGQVAPGAWTPARAFGAGFITEFPGVEMTVPIPRS